MVKRLIVRLQPYMLHSLYAFVSEVRAKMLLAGLPLEAVYCFETAATRHDGSPIQEALRYVDLEIG